MPYLHPDKHDAVARVLVKGKARKGLKPKPSKRPAPGPGLIAALAADMLAARQRKP